MATKQYGNFGKVFMRILFFSRLFHPHIGGVEKHVFEISKILIQKGHRVTIVAEKHDGKLKNFEIINKIGVYRIPILSKGWFKKFEIWGWLLKHKELIKNSDIVHCHDVFFWYFPFRFLFPGKPVFTTFHGYENYPLKSKDILIHKIAEKMSTGNICIGHFMKKWYKTKPDYISYGGVKITNVKNHPFDKLRTKIKNKNSAVFIGRLDDQTGILTYVKAVEIIRKKIPNFDFLVIGDGKFKEKIDRKIKILKPLNNASEYFLEYNFAFVSRYLSILEALAAKRLVFAVYDNSLKEDYLRMSPFAKLINIVSSENELVEKLLHFLKNPREEEMIVNEAFEWVKKHTWEEMTNIHIKLWKKSF